MLKRLLRDVFLQQAFQHNVYNITRTAQSASAHFESEDHEKPLADTAKIPQNVTYQA
jgi:hypothetical protein